MKVLYLYSSGEFPTRKTVWSFIYSFRRHSPHHIYYHNVSIAAVPFWAKWVEFDLIIYSHFMTSPWNPERFRMRMEKFKAAGLRAKRRVAFFQDEYFETKLRVEFLRELNVDAVYSVAPKSEWPKLYPGLPSNVTIHPYLTGYVDTRDIRDVADDGPRDIDIGYRTGWANAGMYRLGRFGALKFRIAEAVRKAGGHLKLDIATGDGFLNGAAWFSFLRRCRYVLGVESGASLLDEDGQIQACIQREVAKNPSATFEQVEATCFPGKDGNLNLNAISPRVFEAAISRTGLILVEGEYNGILQAGVHYLSLKHDFSNAAEVMNQVRDDSIRRRIVNRAYDDLISSGKFTFAHFVQSFFQSQLGARPGGYKFSDRLTYLASNLTEFSSWFMLATLTLFRRLKKCL